MAVWDHAPQDDGTSGRHERAIVSQPDVTVDDPSTVAKALAYMTARAIELEFESDKPGPLREALEKAPDYRPGTASIEWLCFHLAAQQVALSSFTSMRPHLESIIDETVSVVLDQRTLAKAEAELITELGRSRIAEYLNCLRQLQEGVLGAALHLRDLEPFDSPMVFLGLSTTTLMYGSTIAEWLGEEASPNTRNAKAIRALLAASRENAVAGAQKAGDPEVIEFVNEVTSKVVECCNQLLTSGALPLRSTGHFPNLVRGS